VVGCEDHAGLSLKSSRLRDGGCVVLGSGAGRIERVRPSVDDESSSIVKEFVVLLFYFVLFQTWSGSETQWSLPEIWGWRRM